MILCRVNTLAKGYSGIRPEIAVLLLELLNKRVHPLVPSQGSVGASGDLAPLAHLALVLIGEGEAFVSDTPREPGKPERRGKKMSGAKALGSAQIKPLVLEPKEGISLINGTQAMLAVGTLALLAAETLAASADVIGALTVDALKGTDAAFDERIHAARPHAGQSLVAANLRKMLVGSGIRESHRDCG